MTGPLTVGLGGGTVTSFDDLHITHYSMSSSILLLALVLLP